MKDLNDRQTGLTHKIFLEAFLDFLNFRNTLYKYKCLNWNLSDALNEIPRARHTIVHNHMSSGTPTRTARSTILMSRNFNSKLLQ